MRRPRQAASMRRPNSRHTKPILALRYPGVRMAAERLSDLAAYISSVACPADFDTFGAEVMAEAGRIPLTKVTCGPADWTVHAGLD